MTSDKRSDTATSSGPVSVLTCPHCGAVNRIRPSARGAPHCGTCGKPLAWVVDANEETFDVETNASPTVVLDLWAPWCGPCRIVSPILDGFARKHAGRVKVVKVNVDDNQQLALRFDAMSIPTMVVLKDGKVVDRIVGAMPQPALWSRLEPHLKAAKTPTAAKADATR
jgi:thioredoxin 2